VTGAAGSDQATFPVKIGPSLFHEGVDDAFVAKVKPDGTGLVYAGFIGGNDYDAGLGIAVDAAGSAYVTGATYSTEATFPVHVGPGLHHQGGDEAFVAKVKPDGTGILWAGYIGGVSSDLGNAIALDASGDIYVGGTTSSSQATFPVTGGPRVTYGGGNTDGFVAKLAGKPDLYQSFVGLTDTSAKPGGTLRVADMVANGGLGSAAATMTYYFLSLDMVKSPDDVLLTGHRAVPALAPGATSLGNSTVTVPAATPGGSYHLIACADDTKVVAESDETNNCQATGSVVKVGLPNLYVSALIDPPLNSKPGDKFQAIDVVTNGGQLQAPKSTTKYWLSKTNKKDASAVLVGSRVVNPLDPGNTSFGGATVTIPANFPLGPYYLVACADEGKVVVESDESNCMASAAAGHVALPNLTVASVSNPPASIKRGLGFPVTDKVQNNSAEVGAGASTVRYVWSQDNVKGVGDVLLTGTRAVPALGASQSSMGTVTVTVPPAMTPGAYVLFACADDLKKVLESVETDNCTKASSTVNVTQ
jgi:hypothetical protein